VALGVLIDTLIVRSVLVTALTLDAGRHVWWPSRLAARRVEDTAVRAGGELTRTS
jgi:putative drug exporter of the RND superfamily